MTFDDAAKQPAGVPLKPTRPVLLVEDEKNDVLFFKTALVKIQSPLPLQVLTDGESAWEYLTGVESTLRLPRPSLILLDLNLPKRSGLEILTSLKAHSEFRSIPVIVLTSSTVQEDIDAVYALGADFYLLKPFTFHSTMELVQAISAYWSALSEDPDAVGADPTLHKLRKLAEVGSNGPAPTER